MSITFNLNEILTSVIKKAKEDNIVTEDELTLIEEIRLEGRSLDDKISKLKSQNKRKEVLQRLLANSSKVMLKNMVSKAREDGKISSDEQQILEQLFAELGFNLDNFETRPWYIFKICVKIDKTTPMDNLLQSFDKVFCLRGIDPEEVDSGLCLGTKHYVIDGVDVTLLTFAVTPETTQEWVTKGSFAIIEYTKNFDRLLKRTADDLIIENYFSKL